MTGSGKTEVLHELTRMNEQVLDLEGVAHHKGSAFGALGQEKQPTTEQYENDLYEIWKKFDLSKIIWIEDESHAVGSVWINEALFGQMRQSPVIKMEVPKEERIKRLVREYANFDVEVLKGIVKKIERRLGGQHVKHAFECLDRGDFATVADITLYYYDKAYGYGLTQRGDQPIYNLELEKDDPEENAQRVKAFSKTFEL
jgi:tRNA 2-selenouridine synthase